MEYALGSLGEGLPSPSDLLQTALERVRTAVNYAFGLVALRDEAGMATPDAVPR